jgi:hypothetical protein
MRKVAMALIVLTVLAVTAVGQEVERRRGGPGRWHGRRAPGPAVSWIVDRMAEELNFDDEQMAQIDEIVAAHEERMQETRARWQELRAAVEAGDEERAAELREQLRQQRGERGRAIEAVFDEIEPLLREEQLEGFQQFRERGSRRRGPGDRGRMRQMLRELPDAVEMTEEQRGQYEELLAEQRQRMRERWQQRRQRGEGNEAERAARRGPPDFAALQDEFFEQVAQILNEEQLPLLAEYRARIETAGRRSRSAETDDVRMVVSAAKRVRDLSTEQKDALREVEREAMRSYGELRRDREGLALLAAEVKARIVKLLGKEQVEQFERNLDRLKARDRRGERGGRGHRARERMGRDREDPPEEP